jgi:hypothetical protein
MLDTGIALSFIAANTTKIRLGRIIGAFFSFETADSSFAFQQANTGSPREEPQRSPRLWGAPPAASQLVGPPALDSSSAICSSELLRHRYGKENISRAQVVS